jgi:hypothetical protein
MDEIIAWLEEFMPTWRDDYWDLKRDNDEPRPEYVVIERLKWGLELEKAFEGIRDALAKV